MHQNKGIQCFPFSTWRTRKKKILKLALWLIWIYWAFQTNQKTDTLTLVSFWEFEAHALTVFWKRHTTSSLQFNLLANRSFQITQKNSPFLHFYSVNWYWSVIWRFAYTTSISVVNLRSIVHPCNWTLESRWSSTLSFLTANVFKLR